ncbi:Uncharacterised protein [Chlamydia trachomatis]|nr:Uncharacterised protein [Chlamydia trachomatis]
MSWTEIENPPFTPLIRATASEYLPAFKPTDEY